MNIDKKKLPEDMQKILNEMTEEIGSKPTLHFGTYKHITTKEDLSFLAQGLNKKLFIMENEESPREFSIAAYASYFSTLDMLIRLGGQYSIDKNGRHKIYFNGVCSGSIDFNKE